LLVPVLIALESLAVGETCPAAVDVEARVRTILHLAPEQRLAESFVVERHEAGLYVVLRGADSTVIGERTLPLAGSCDELAQAAAVVLSAWLTDVHPDFAGALPARPEPEAEPEPPPPEPEPKPEPKPKPTARPPTANVRAEEPVVYRFEAGLGLGIDFTNAAFAPAALASVGYTAQDKGFGVVALLVATTLREDAHAPGTITWWRWPAGLGPSYRLSISPLSADLSAGPVAAWLHLEGSGFTSNDTQEVLTWGGFATLRVSGRARPFAPFGLLNLQIYPADARATVKGIVPQWPIPRWSLLASIGARFSH
jgi:hypothetical protein